MSQNPPKITKINFKNKFHEINSQIYIKKHPSKEVPLYPYVKKISLP